MIEDNSPTTVELAVHKNILDYFDTQPDFKQHSLSRSVMPEYDIVTLENVDYMKIIPIVQQFLPFIKVITPAVLDMRLRKHLRDYDRHDLSNYRKSK